ncbi:hypothetical protein TGDOM2_251460, partial [Toxoplasma gondii GAB2-2007-GAL-DOM2]
MDVSGDRHLLSPLCQAESPPATSLNAFPLIDGFTGEVYSIDLRHPLLASSRRSPRTSSGPEASDACPAWAALQLFLTRHVIPALPSSAVCAAHVQSFGKPREDRAATSSSPLACSPPSLPGATDRPEGEALANPLSSPLHTSASSLSARQGSCLSSDGRGRGGENEQEEVRFSEGSVLLLLEQTSTSLEYEVDRHREGSPASLLLQPGEPGPIFSFRLDFLFSPLNSGSTGPSEAPREETAARSASGNSFSVSASSAVPWACKRGHRPESLAARACPAPFDSVHLHTYQPLRVDEASADCAASTCGFRFPFPLPYASSSLDKRLSSAEQRAVQTASALCTDSGLQPFASSVRTAAQLLAAGRARALAAAALLRRLPLQRRAARVVQGNLERHLHLAARWLGALSARLEEERRLQQPLFDGLPALFSLFASCALPPSFQRGPCREGDGCKAAEAGDAAVAGAGLGDSPPRCFATLADALDLATLEKHVRRVAAQRDRVYIHLEEVERRCGEACEAALAAGRRAVAVADAGGALEEEALRVEAAGQEAASLFRKVLEALPPPPIAYSQYSPEQLRERQRRQAVALQELRRVAEEQASSEERVARLWARRGAEYLSALRRAFEGKMEVKRNHDVGRLVSDAAQRVAISTLQLGRLYAVPRACALAVQEARRRRRFRWTYTAAARAAQAQLDRARRGEEAARLRFLESCGHALPASLFAPLRHCAVPPVFVQGPAEFDEQLIGLSSLDFASFLPGGMGPRSETASTETAGADRREKREADATPGSQRGVDAGPGAASPERDRRRGEKGMLSWNGERGEAPEEEGPPEEDGPPAHRRGFSPLAETQEEEFEQKLMRAAMSDASAAARLAAERLHATLLSRGGATAEKQYMDAEASELGALTCWLSAEETGAGGVRGEGEASGERAEKLELACSSVAQERRAGQTDENNEGVGEATRRLQKQPRAAEAAGTSGAQEQENPGDQLSSQRGVRKHTQGVEERLWSSATAEEASAEAKRHEKGGRKEIVSNAFKDEGASDRSCAFTLSPDLEIFSRTAATPRVSVQTPGSSLGFPRAEVGGKLAERRGDNEERRDGGERQTEILGDETLSASRCSGGLKENSVSPRCAPFRANVDEISTCNTAAAPGGGTTSCPSSASSSISSSSASPSFLPSSPISSSSSFSSSSASSSCSPDLLSSSSFSCASGSPPSSSFSTSASSSSSLSSSSAGDSSSLLSSEASSPLCLSCTGRAESVRRETGDQRHIQEEGEIAGKKRDREKLATAEKEEEERKKSDGEKQETTEKEEERRKSDGEKHETTEKEEERRKSDGEKHETTEKEEERKKSDGEKHETTEKEEERKKSDGEKQETTEKEEEERRKSDGEKHETTEKEEERKKSDGEKHETTEKEEERKKSDGEKHGTTEKEEDERRKSDGEKQETTEKEEERRKKSDGEKQETTEKEEEERRKSDGEKQ